MLVIRITGITGPAGTPPKYELTLDGKGKGKGQSIAYDPIEDVQWEITGNVIKSIEDISWKEISGSTNIFPPRGTPHPNPNMPFYPEPVNAQKKVWRAKINNINDDVVYLYTIKFKINGSDNSTYEHDPIISIKPSQTFRGYILGVLGLLVGGVVSVLVWRQKNFIKKENERLKEENQRLRGESQ